MSEGAKEAFEYVDLAFCWMCIYTKREEATWPSPDILEKSMTLLTCRGGTTAGAQRMSCPHTSHLHIVSNMIRWSRPSQTAFCKNLG